MNTSWPLVKLLYGLTEENYDCMFSAYHFWIEAEAAYGGVLNHQLDNNILSSPSMMSSLITTPQADYHTTPIIEYNNTRQYNPRGRLIHPNIHLLLCFITDAELDPTLSTSPIGLHDRLCRESLEQFFKHGLDYILGGWKKPTSEQLREFYTQVNLIAHWVNLGYVKLEDVRDRILQSLVYQPTVHPHQLNSLMILLRISGATFAAHVNPSVMDCCCDLLKLRNLSLKLVLFDLAEVRAPVLTIGISYEC